MNVSYGSNTSLEMATTCEQHHTDCKQELVVAAINIRTFTKCYSCLKKYPRYDGKALIKFRIGHRAERRKVISKYFDN